MLLTEPLLTCPCCVFGVIVMLEDPSTTHLQCSYWGKEVVGQNLAIHGPHPPINTVLLSCPLGRKALPKHGVLGIVLILLLPPNTASGAYTKKLYFGLIWPHDLLPCLLWISSQLIPHLSQDNWYSMRRDLAWSPSPREIGNHLEFLQFSNNCTNSCCLLTKLFAYCPVAHPSLVQVYKNVPSSP